MTGEGTYGFPCKTCEIDAQISRVRLGNDRKGKVSRSYTHFFFFGELFRLRFNGLYANYI
uniref:Uncharacterized protein n=1 Tax=Chlorobium phaeobacteroides (strain BS1) TaxID=331678 RepID=B3EP10_CHLPB